MNKAEIERFKQELVSLRSGLQQQKVFEGTAKSIELEWTRVDRQRQHQLLIIEGAFRRIEIGEYGYCVVCGDEIGLDRLSIDPANTRCVKCAEK